MARWSKETKLNLCGQKYGRLEVLYEGCQKSSGKRRWVCRCDCKDQTVLLVNQATLRNGHTKSCGCYHKETMRRLMFKHGEDRSAPEYMAWQNMRRRCRDPKNQDYARYGGRGIRVCDEWVHSYESFLGHVGRRPTPKHTLDRINPDGDYEPGNVRWATAREQRINQSRCWTFMFFGYVVTMEDLAKKYGVSRWKVKSLLERNNWDAYAAMAEWIPDADL